ncbi:MAG TPA: hypothetical protein VFQ89_00375, partial [Candidatus Binatia bacterium]|nr:hypothetical protein [Candidatus Binatia bacterium]
PLLELHRKAAKSDTCHRERREGFRLICQLANRDFSVSPGNDGYDKVCACGKLSIVRWGVKKTTGTGENRAFAGREGD